MVGKASFTQLLTDWRTGRPEALERLAPLVYEELRKLARGYMRGERDNHTLQATAVVHEAFLRLVQSEVPWQDRNHFFAVAARLMRRVLVDHAKTRMRSKRFGTAKQVSLDRTDESIPDAGFDLVDMDDALSRLSEVDPRLSQVIELHYFGGLTYDQIAEALGSSQATVHRELRLARAWLMHELKLVSEL